MNVQSWIHKITFKQGPLFYPVGFRSPVIIFLWEWGVKVTVIVGDSFHFDQEHPLQLNFEKNSNNAQGLVHSSFVKLRYFLNNGKFLLSMLNCGANKGTEGFCSEKYGRGVENKQMWISSRQRLDSANSNHISVHTDEREVRETGREREGDSAGYRTVQPSPDRRRRRTGAPFTWFTHFFRRSSQQHSNSKWCLSRVFFLTQDSTSILFWRRGQKEELNEPVPLTGGKQLSWVNGRLQLREQQRPVQGQRPILRHKWRGGSIWQRRPLQRQ